LHGRNFSVIDYRFNHTRSWTRVPVLFNIMKIIEKSQTGLMRAQEKPKQRRMKWRTLQ